MFTTVLAFIGALAVLIAAHEYGHYRVAVACGVKVLRFSIGFGRPLLRWHNARGTEFTLAWMPLGGYVRMLDEREAPVPETERAQAFNNQPLRARVAIVAAGPLANLLLAVLMYAAMNWLGAQQAAAVLAQPRADSVAAQAGLGSRDVVLALAVGDDEPQPVRSYDTLRWPIMQAVLDAQDVHLQVRQADGRERHLTLALASLPHPPEVDPALWEALGFAGPYTEPLIGRVLPDGPAQAAGLREGDRVRRVGATEVLDGAHLRGLIRSATAAAPQMWTVERRDGQVMSVRVAPRVVTQDGQRIGRIDAYVGGEPQWTLVRDGPVAGVWHGAQQTWDSASLTLRMLGRMLVGQASLKNLSGPVTMAEFAGRSAHMGWSAYLGFLALVSVSLGVLNLLPIPVLDGGHLLYYLFEGLNGRPLSEQWLDRLQKGGLAILGLLMSVALFNDLSRLLG